MAKKVNLGKKSDITVNIFVDVSDPDNLRILGMDEEVRLNKDSLPEDVIKLTTTWRRSNYMLQQLVEANSFSEKIVGNMIQRVFDPNAMTQAQIRCLLTSWNFNELDPDFTLSFEGCVDNPKIKVLDSATMTKMGELTPPQLMLESHARMLMESMPKNSKFMEPVKEETKTT